MKTILQFFTPHGYAEIPTNPTSFKTLQNFYITVTNYYDERNQLLQHLFQITDGKGKFILNNEDENANFHIYFTLSL